ncbi:unnamed protein product [Sphagnum jensenii]|uniref:Tyr recombinase domain-containing protein n=1 Tax=Sphagnum jensenii TaxID=128206 RepID=A0ABP0VGS1_9BRYO
MSRQIKDAILESREARKRLKIQSEPHWRGIDTGLHLGYRRRSNGGSWIARRFTETGKYIKHKLGVADDFQDADVEGKGLSVAKAIVNAHIIPALGMIRLDRLTTKRISDWMKNLAAAPARLRTGKSAKERNVSEVDENTDHDIVRRRRASVNRVLTVLKAALNYAWREGKIASDTPWRKVKPFRNADAPVIRYLSEAECIRLINACVSDLRAMVQAALLTGCRYGELVILRVSDFNPDTRTLAIRTSKSGKPRHVVLTDEAGEFFQAAVIGKESNALIFTHDNGSGCTIVLKGSQMSEIVIYEQEGHPVKVRLEGGTVWLTQRQIADLLDASIPSINIHINGIYEDGELNQGATIKESLIVQTEGKRTFSRPVILPSQVFYNNGNGHFVLNQTIDNAQSMASH